MRKPRIGDICTRFGDGDTLYRVDDIQPDGVPVVTNLAYPWESFRAKPQGLLRVGIRSLRRRIATLDAVRTALAEALARGPQGRPGL